MSDAIDQAGFAGLALVAYHYTGILGAGLALTLTSLGIALLVAGND